VLVGTQAEDVGVVDDEEEGIGVALDDDETSDMEDEVDIRAFEEDAEDGDALASEDDCVALTIEETGMTLEESVSEARDDAEVEVLEESTITVADAVAEMVDGEDTPRIEEIDCEIPADICVEVRIEEELAHPMS
jgi:hypothetical protein